MILHCLCACFRCLQGAVALCVNCDRYCRQAPAFPLPRLARACLRCGLAKDAAFRVSGRRYSARPDQLAPPWAAQSSFFVGLRFGATAEDEHAPPAEALHVAAQGSVALLKDVMRGQRREWGESKEQRAERREKSRGDEWRA